MSQLPKYQHIIFAPHQLLFFLFICIKRYVQTTYFWTSKRFLFQVLSFGLIVECLAPWQAVSRQVFENCSCFLSALLHHGHGLNSNGTHNFYNTSTNFKLILSHKFHLNSTHNAVLLETCVVCYRCRHWRICWSDHHREIWEDGTDNQWLHGSIGQGFPMPVSKNLSIH